MAGFLCVCISRTGRRQFRALSSRPTLRPVWTPARTRPWWIRPGWDRQSECRHHKNLPSSTCCTHAARFLHHADFFFCFGKALSVMAFSKHELLCRFHMHVLTAGESVSEELHECIIGCTSSALAPCAYSQNLVHSANRSLLPDVSHSCGLSWLSHMSHYEWSYMKKSWYDNCKTQYHGFNESQCILARP